MLDILIIFLLFIIACELGMLVNFESKAYEAYKKVEERVEDESL